MCVRKGGAVMGMYMEQNGLLRRPKIKIKFGSEPIKANILAFYSHRNSNQSVTPVQTVTQV